MANSKPLIFLLYTCDEWKSTSSMKLLVAANRASQIKKVIEHEIKEQSILYGRERESTSPAGQIREFRQDWKTLSRRELNDFLCYAYLDTTYSGEII